MRKSIHEAQLTELALVLQAVAQLCIILCIIFASFNVARIQTARPLREVSQSSNESQFMLIML